jgi:hypothetical protein
MSCVLWLSCLIATKFFSGEIFGVFTCRCNEDAIFYGQIEEDIICQPQ